MADTFDLEIATPDRLVVQLAVTEAQIPAKGGYIGVLPGHAPLLSQLGTGYASYVAGGQRCYLALHGGFVEVLPDKVRLVAEEVEKAEEIDVARAKEELRQANEQLANPHVEVEPAAALEAMYKAQAKLDAATNQGRH